MSNSQKKQSQLVNLTSCDCFSLQDFFVKIMLHLCYRGIFVMLEGEN